jgi:hypothetical protein
MHSEQRELEVSIAREVDGAVPAGWEELRFEVAALGNFQTYLIHVNRAGTEERAIPPFVVSDHLVALKMAVHVEDRGTWVSLTMLLSAAGALDIHYNFDDKPNFDFEVSARDYELELECFPRSEEAVPAWWRESIARGDE